MLLGYDATDPTFVVISLTLASPMRAGAWLYLYDQEGATVFVRLQTPADPAWFSEPTNDGSEYVFHNTTEAAAGNYLFVIMTSWMESVGGITAVLYAPEGSEIAVAGPPEPGWI